MIYLNEYEYEYDGVCIICTYVDGSMSFVISGKSLFVDGKMLHSNKRQQRKIQNTTQTQMQANDNVRYNKVLKRQTDPIHW